MPAASLEEAASLSYIRIVRRADPALYSLPAAFAGFNADVLAVFPGDQVEAQRTVANWLVVGLAIEQNISAVEANYPPVLEACLYVYQLCWAASTAAGAGRITAAQGNAILAAWNDNID